MELPREQQIFEAYLDKAASEVTSLAQRIQGCDRCDRGQHGGRPLIGAGYPLADFFLLKGQASEGEHGAQIAFSGAVAEVLGRSLKRLGSDISFVFGTNAVKCYKERSTLNENEIKACSAYLRAEIEVCQPKVILAMGPVSCRALKLMGGKLEEIEYHPGAVFKLRPDLQVVVTCEAEEALKDEEKKREFWAHLQMAKTLLDKEIAKEQER